MSSQRASPVLLPPPRHLLPPVPMVPTPAPLPTPRNNHRTNQPTNPSPKKARDSIHREMRHPTRHDLISLGSNYPHRTLYPVSSAWRQEQ
ncbi:hypothetical protein BDV19DRAFT_365473 [Aspergillus venezuelensis]